MSLQKDDKDFQQWVTDTAWAFARLGLKPDDEFLITLLHAAWTTGAAYESRKMVRR